MENLSTIASDFGRKIQSQRLAADMTQAELAAELGVSTRAIQTWEAGESFPRPSHRRRISEFFEKQAA